MYNEYKTHCGILFEECNIIFLVTGESQEG